MVHTHRDLGSRLTADQALARLKAGNLRFLEGKAQFPTMQKDVLAMMARGQAPFATILGCSRDPMLRAGAISRGCRPERARAVAAARRDHRRR